MRLVNQLQNSMAMVWSWRQRKELENMIGQAILTRGIGGALESAAFRMGDAAILRGALANPVLSKVVTLGPKAREVAGIMGSTYAVTYYQNYQQAIESGLPEGEASTYANLSSLRISSNPN
jgi:hypothetical protein